MGHGAEGVYPFPYDRRASDMKSPTIFRNCLGEIIKSATGAYNTSDEKALERIREIEFLCKMTRSALGAKSLAEEESDNAE
jgi:hypothetical protein